MAETIVNKVAESGLITLDLENWVPRQEIKIFDLKDFLFMGLILKEKEFREALKQFDWTVYRDQYVAVTCSADAIIPMWAYMLIASNLQPLAKDFFLGTAEDFQRSLFIQNLQSIDPCQFTDQRVVVKGCGDTPIGAFAYLEITKILMPVAKTIMYGEPCSTVPVYKKR